MLVLKWHHPKNSTCSWSSRFFYGCHMFLFLFVSKGSAILGNLATGCWVDPWNCWTFGEFLLHGRCCHRPLAHLSSVSSSSSSSSSKNTNSFMPISKIRCISAMTWRCWTSSWGVVLCGTWGMAYAGFCQHLQLHVTNVDETKMSYVTACLFFTGEWLRNTTIFIKFCQLFNWSYMKLMRRKEMEGNRRAVVWIPPKLRALPKISGHWLLYDLVADVATWCQDMG